MSNSIHLDTISYTCNQSELLAYVNDTSFKRQEHQQHLPVVRFVHLDPPMQHAETKDISFFVITQQVVTAIQWLLLHYLHMVSAEIVSSDQYYYCCVSSLSLGG